MGIRTIKRQISKARLKAIGVDRVNRRMKVVSEEGIIWRRILNDAKAHDAQAKGRKPVYLTRKTNRKIRKVEA